MTRSGSYVRRSTETIIRGVEDACIQPGDSAGIDENLVGDGGSNGICDGWAGVL